MKKKESIRKISPKNVASRRYLFWIELLTRMLLAASVTVLVTLPLLSGINDALALSKPMKKASVVASSLEELANGLAEKGIIKHPRLFFLYATLKDAGSIAKEITVEADSGMDYRALLRLISNEGTPSVLRLTIPQGATTDEIIDLFEKNGLGSRERFVDTINSYPFEHDFLPDADITTKNGRKYRLDGYLYPDTYDFYTDRSEAYYIYKLLDRFDAVTEELRMKESGLSLDDAVILASMISRSSSFVGQYEYLSSVFHNRLVSPETYPCLECPAASVYGISGRGGVFCGVPDEEIKKAPSGYNTYITEGLPPGPICNPDVRAITCALRPAESKYRYFITDENGCAFFASSRKEYDRLCEKIIDGGA